MYDLFCFSFIKVISNLKSLIDLWNLLLETVPFPLFHHHKQQFSNFLGFPGGSDSQEPTCQCKRYRRPRFDPWLRKVPWRRKWQPTAVLFLPGESHGQSNLMGYTVHGVAKSQTWLSSEHFHAFNFSVYYFGYLSLITELVAPWIFSCRHCLLVSSCRWQCFSVAFPQCSRHPFPLLPEDCNSFGEITLKWTCSHHIWTGVSCIAGGFFAN